MLELLGILFKATVWWRLPQGCVYVLQTVNRSLPGLLQSIIGKVPFVKELVSTLAALSKREVPKGSHFDGFEQYPLGPLEVSFPLT